MGRVYHLATLYIYVLYLILINNFAITQLENLRRKWRVKKFQYLVMKVKEREGFLFLAQEVKAPD